jgi:hypothetical protein
MAPRKDIIETCRVNHQGDPVALEPKTLYILRQSSPTPQILLSPFLHAARLDPDFINELLQELHDLSDWAQIFRTVRVTLTQTSGFVSHARHNEHQRFFSQPLRTPASPRAQSWLQVDVKTVRESEDDNDDDDDFVLAEEATIWDNLPKTPIVNLEGLSMEEECASGRWGYCKMPWPNMVPTKSSCILR